MNTHTPGPWEVNFEHDARGYPLFYINGMSGEQKRDEVTLQANARLIAAAPDLLRALQSLYALVNGECPSLLEDDHHAMMVEEAIAKATR